MILEDVNGGLYLFLQGDTLGSKAPLRRGRSLNYYNMGC